MLSGVWPHLQAWMNWWPAVSLPSWDETNIVEGDDDCTSSVLRKESDGLVGLHLPGFSDTRDEYLPVLESAEGAARCMPREHHVERMSSLPKRAEHASCSATRNWSLSPLVTMCRHLWETPVAYFFPEANTFLRCRLIWLYSIGAADNMSVITESAEHQAPPRQRTRNLPGI